VWHVAGVAVGQFKKLFEISIAELFDVSSLLHLVVTHGNDWPLSFIFDFKVKVRVQIIEAAHKLDQEFAINKVRLLLSHLNHKWIEGKRKLFDCIESRWTSESGKNLHILNSFHDVKDRVLLKHCKVLLDHIRSVSYKGVKLFVLGDWLELSYVF
jgi:hypothetical protein